MSLLQYTPTKWSAFAAGVIFGSLGTSYEVLSEVFRWNGSQRNIAFVPLAIFGFLLPIIFLVVGPRYAVVARARNWPEIIGVWRRAPLWFLGIIAGMFLIGLLVFPFLAYAVPRGKIALFGHPST
jgi:hypothetical protein